MAEYEARAILTDGRTATVTVEAEDTEEAKYLLHHCGHTVTVEGERLDVERYDYRTVKRAHQHKLKLVDFNEDTGVGKWACKCGFEKERTAAFMCAVPGAE
jgi:hypothetical protein